MSRRNDVAFMVAWAFGRCGMALGEPNEDLRRNRRVGILAY